MKFILPFLVAALTQTSWAAIPSNPSKPSLANPSSDLALELLSMPEANRKQIAQQKSDDLYPELIKLSKSDQQSMETRWKALTLAAYIGKDKALDELNAALKAKEWYLRNAALVALKIYHPLKAQAAAKELLKDKALVVRSAAVDVLGSQLDSKTRDLLWEEYTASYNFRKKQSLWIRGQILSQLAEKPEPRESVLFVKALKEKETQLHAPAVAALEKITQSNLGSKSNVAQKRELWLQWAKAHPQTSVQ